MKVPIETLPIGSLCRFSDVKHSLIVWCPKERLFEGINQGDPWDGEAFTCEAEDTLLLVIGKTVPVRDSFCVPVLVGGQRHGWIYSKTEVVLEA